MAMIQVIAGCSTSTPSNGAKNQRMACADARESQGHQAQDQVFNLANPDALTFSRSLHHLHVCVPFSHAELDGRSHLGEPAPECMKTTLAFNTAHFQGHRRHFRRKLSL